MSSATEAGGANELIDQPLFGATLRTYLNGTSIQELADAIYVERSVIYRWLRDERVPRLNTDHLANIAKYLRLDSRAIERLRQAQVASLSRTGIESASPKRKRQATRRAVDQFMEGTQRTTGSSAGMSASMRALLYTRTSQPRQESLANWSTAVELIEHALPNPQMENPTILISMQGDGPLMVSSNSNETFGPIWQRALRTALIRGWKIEHYLRLDRNVGRSLRIVESMFEMFGLPGYSPRFFERYGILQPPYDLVVIPGHATMILLATANSSQTDDGLILVDPNQEEVIRAHFAQLRQHTKPLLRIFSVQRQELEFTQAMVAAEALPGGRLLIKDGVSAITYPPTWLRVDSFLAHIVQQSGVVSRFDIPAYMADLQRRLATFETLVQRNEYLDVCPQRAMHRLCDAGEVDSDIPLHSHYMPLELRLEHLDHIIYLLQTYENYHIALVDEHSERTLRVDPTRLITGERDAFITAHTLDASDKLTIVQIQMSEPTIVAALREHFTDLWERIAPIQRQKSYVIAWLQRQADVLRERIRTEPGA